MSKTRSFEKLDYSTRPNKNVERKLMLALLRRVGSNKHFDVPQYRYIGLGSIWFTDFSLMHRVAGITDMISIEREASREERLRFNKPFDCITLDLRDYSDAFPDLKWEKRTVVWLDFDDRLRLSLFDDLRRTLTMVPSGSLVFVTANADSWQLNGISKEEQHLKPAEALRQFVPETDLPPDHEKRLTRIQFPALVGEIFGNAFKNAVSADRPGLAFKPLMNLAYADNAPIVTYGGILLDATDSAAFNAIEMKDLAFLVEPPQFKLSVPHLTAREKMRFDQLLPCGEMPTAEELGFELRPKEIEAYVKFYLEYPVFGEYYF